MQANPSWSAGLQLGNEGGTGIVAQRVGIAGGAVNVGLGVADRGLAAHGDYLLFLGDGFKLVKLKRVPGYNGIRGHIMPYVGAGAQISKGLSLRFPVGVQYGMLRDPFNFYGAVALMLGRFLADDDLGATLGIMIGTRVLL